MGEIRTNAAAAMLGVSPSTLRTWERRFGFPEPRRTAGGHRQYDVAEVEALRAAFEETQNVSSAVGLARERGAGPPTAARLRAALGRFDEQEADRVLEESLAVRSLERSVDEILLGAVDALAGEHADATASAELGFAWRWATCWLSAACRAAPPATREEAVMVLDATHARDVDALHVQALELVVRRRGLRALTLPVGLEPARLTRALDAVAPRAVVLAGRGADLDALARLVFAVRRAGRDVAVCTFRGALPETAGGTVLRLGERPLAALRVLGAELEDAGVRARRTGPRRLRAVAW